ncbi:MAG: response regulator transcription factor [Dolichospermum sp. DEX182a]|nr:response regulator transcription factor [Dolichospermum sp. DEX182a]QSV65347.1 MAG: response regulator transcription factor [Dolichospermum sp. DL01]
MSEISILLIEAHDLTRMGLKTKLQLHGGFKVIGEAANATQGLNLLVTMKPNVAVIDIGLPGMDGIELTRKFRRYQAETGQSQTRILILTMNNTEDAVLAAFAAGADSYYMKDTRFNKFIEAVQATANGNFWIDPAIASVVLRKMRQGVPGDHQSLDKPKTYPLTQRELEILELIVGGCSNGQIAEKLYITVGTVKTHVRNILNKLCADDSL